MIEGLMQGRTLCVDRKDAPELPQLLRMQEMGLVTSRLVDIDEQSSVLKFIWIGPMDLNEVKQRFLPEGYNK